MRGTWHPCHRKQLEESGKQSRTGHHTSHLTPVCASLRVFAASRDTNRPQSPLAPVKRGRGVGGEGATFPQHTTTGQHGNRSLTRGLPSAARLAENRKPTLAFPFAASRDTNCPRFAHQSPLAPVKRGRGVGGEGATSPQHTTTGQHGKQSLTRGLPSAARLTTSPSPDLSAAPPRSRPCHHDPINTPQSCRQDCAEPPNASPTKLHEMSRSPAISLPSSP